MHWISILFIAFASNLDNLGIGISFGVRSTKITATSNAIIALITMAGTFSSISLGKFISQIISGFTANLIGAVMIAVIGIWVIISGFRKEIIKKQMILDNTKVINVIRNPDTADVDFNNIISLKESVALGIALALNNMATGFGAGATGVSPLWTTLAAGVMSFLFIGVGSRAGYTIARTWFGQYSNLSSGILLLLIGIYEIII